MATYCFYCRNCGAGFTADTRDPAAPFCCDEPVMVRDYRGEAVAPAIASLKREREMGHSRSMAEAQKSIFLPTQDEFRTPEDPSGSKGMNNWLETHGPKPGNKNPVYPDRDKTVLAGYTGK